jgi:hypothetical protein
VRGRLPLFVLLGSSLTFLASLYLPWEAAAAKPCAHPHDLPCILNLYSESNVELNAWGPFGQPAAVLALALAVTAVAAIARPRLASRLPLATAGLALFFFTVLSAFELRNVGRLQALHVAYGTYLGLATATISFLCAVVLRWREFERSTSAPAVAGAVLTLGLLAAYLVPQLTFRVPHVNHAATGTFISLQGFLVETFGAGLACFALPLWGRNAPATTRLAGAAGIAVLTAGYLAPVGTHVRWPWELWLLLGCAAGLLVLALVTHPPRRIARPSIESAALTAAGVLVLAALFLPWEDGLTGWSLSLPSTAGALTVILLVLLLRFERLFVELALGVEIYILAAGLASGSLDYGAPIGFAGAALLLLLAARRLRIRVQLGRVLPLGACAAFVAIPVLTYTDRVFWAEALSPWRLFWLEIVAIVAASRLFARWLNRPRDSREIVALPFVLLALTALDLIYDRYEGLRWGGVATVVLCLLLAGFGWAERNGKLEKFRIPEEIWRVDRLPPFED